MKFRPFNYKNKYYSFFVVALILTIVAGWLLTGYLGRVANNELTKDTDREASLIHSLLKDNLEDVDNAVKSLSQAEPLLAALKTGSPADMEYANRLLDRYRSSMEMSVCYLLDRNGLTVASSNRNEAAGFVDISFVLKPYFTGAIAGRLTRHFGLGKISHERGYYAAAPVVDKSGAITGVVVIKRNIAPVEKEFRKYLHVYLVSPDGIIFVSSTEKLVYRSLWPVAEKRRAEILASQQFGSISFEPLLAAEPRSGTYVRFENEDHYLLRLPFGSDGWTFVVLESPRIFASYRLFGILITIVFTLLLLFFFNLLLYKTRSLEAARELLKSKDDWKRTFDTVPDLIALINADNRITSINRAMAERLGIASQEAVGRRCFELVHGSKGAPLSCPHRRMIDSGSIQTGSLFEKNLNGDFVVTAVPILAENGTIESSIYVMHDVTEMKRLSDEVNRIHNLEAIGLLAGGLAHDFNNVLSTIYGNVSFAKMFAGGNRAVVEPLTDAEEACERAKELGIRLQAFMQGTSQVKEPVALPAIIGAASEALFKGSNISATIIAAADLLPVEADPRRIRQVFDNLLTNAKEAMAAGGTVRIDIRNYVADGNNGTPLGSGPYVCISLQDSGKGIPEDNLPKIFDPYFSTKDTYSQKGLGLGLSICHAVLKRHGGHISIESRVGIGTRVFVYLPAAVGEAELPTAE